MGGEERKRRYGACTAGLVPSTWRQESTLKIILKGEIGNIHVNQQSVSGHSGCSPTVLVSENSPGRSVPAFLGRASEQRAGGHGEVWRGVRGKKDDLEDVGEGLASVCLWKAACREARPGQWAGVGGIHRPLEKGRRRCGQLLLPGSRVKGEDEKIFKFCSSL